jgi:hypothetical protein
MVEQPYTYKYNQIIHTEPLQNGFDETLFYHTQSSRLSGAL